MIDKGSGELAIQAMSGVCEGVVDDNKQVNYIQSMICEKVTGYYAAIAASSAYFAKQRGSGGQCVEINMLDSIMHFNMVDIFMNKTWEKKVTAELLVKTVYSTKFTSKDGIDFYSISVSDKEWEGFARVFADDLHDYKDKVDGLWKTLMGRISDAPAMVKMLDEASGRYNFAELQAKCKEADVAIAPFLSCDEVLEDAQVVHNQIVYLEDYDNLGPYRLPIPAPIFSKTPVKLRRPAPLPGAHTESILEDIDVGISIFTA